MAGGTGRDGRSENLCQGTGEESGFFLTRESRQTDRPHRRLTGTTPAAWWGHINDLVAAGHGPLQNILDNYTLTHINKFLRGIDRKERREQLRRIYDHRIAGATTKGFKDAVRHLRQQEQAVDAAERHGQRMNRGPMTPAEQQALDAQGHYRLSALPEDEQQRLIAQRDALWLQIPEHLQDKARKMAGR